MNRLNKRNKKSAELDERQKMDMYEVEHYSFWVLFWGMLIVLVVETMILDAPKEYVIPIFIVFMTGAIVSVIGYYKKGIWDGKTSKPSYGASFRYSLFFTVLFTIIFAADRKSVV